MATLIPIMTDLGLGAWCRSGEALGCGLQSPDVGSLLAGRLLANRLPPADRAFDSRRFPCPVALPSLWLLGRSQASRPCLSPGNGRFCGAAGPAAQRWLLWPGRLDGVRRFSQGRAEPAPVVAARRGAPRPHAPATVRHRRRWLDSPRAAQLVHHERGLPQVRQGPERAALARERAFSGREFLRRKGRPSPPPRAQSARLFVPGSVLASPCPCAGAPLRTQLRQPTLGQ